MINFSPNSCSGPWNLWRTECHNGSHQSSLPTPSLILPGLSPFPGGDCRSRTRLWFLYYSPLLFDEPLQLKKRLVGMSSPCYLKERKKRQIYSNMYMLWLNFILGLNFIFLCFNLIIIHYHTPEQGKMKFKPRIKLNYCTTYTLSSLEMASVFFRSFTSLLSSHQWDKMVWKSTQIVASKKWRERGSLTAQRSRQMAGNW